MEVSQLTQKPWWNYLEDDLRELLKESFLLAEIFGERKQEFHDYAFVVFPAAKAYEGFLKKLFLDMGFISETDYFGKFFRLGKALNPSLEKKYRNDSWVYEKLAKYCSGDYKLPDQLWQTWKESRNLIFHWFPNEKRAISFSEAQERLTLVVKAMDAAFTTCKIK
jgi:hypothetical protein